MNLVSSRRFFSCRLRNLLTVFFMSRDVLVFSGNLSQHIYIRWQDFRERVEEKERSVLISGDLLWISIGVTSG